MTWSIDLFDFKCFNLSPHRQIYLPSESLAEMLVSKMSVKVTIPIWYFRVWTA